MGLDGGSNDAVGERREGMVFSDIVDDRFDGTDPLAEGCIAEAGREGGIVLGSRNMSWESNREPIFLAN